MTEQNIIEKLNKIAIESNWGSAFRVNGVPEHIAVIKEAIDYIIKLEKECSLLSGKLIESAVEIAELNSTIRILSKEITNNEI